MNKFRLFMYILAGLFYLALLISYPIYVLGISIIAGIIFVVVFYDKIEQGRKHKTGVF